MKNRKQVDEYFPLSIALVSSVFLFANRRCQPEFLASSCEEANHNRRSLQAPNPLLQLITPPLNKVRPKKRKEKEGG